MSSLVNKQQTPRQAGFRWAAEWEPHQATWLAWPHNQDTWPGIFARIPDDFARLATLIARFEPVHILVDNEAMQVEAERLLSASSGEFRFHVLPTNDAWIRDYGPTFLQRSAELSLVDWQYNAWGGKYPPFDRDNAVAGWIAGDVGCRRFSPGLTLEGGAVNGNGAGTILTTRSCLLSPTRNPTMTEATVERYLREYLAAERIVWLDGQVIAGDDTDGHIDQLARFVNSHCVVYAESHPADSSTFEVLSANRRRLTEVSIDGCPLELVPLGLPHPQFHEGAPLPASYCNFYFVNGALLVPTFADVADDRALQTLADLCPDREVIGFDVRNLIWGLGAIHCLTQQQPARNLGATGGQNEQPARNLGATGGQNEQPARNLGATGGQNEQPARNLGATGGPDEQHGVPPA